LVKAKHDIADLLSIMAALRTPVTGCPWDLEQTYATIVPYTIEEAYEVADAIEREDFNALKDELGDLLLQVVYHARMAEEDGEFSFDDVVGAICEKMIRRHPHVFGDEKERANVDLDGLWERVKAQEKSAGQSGSDPKGSESVLDGVPHALPALLRAVKLQNKAARVGFDWPSMEPVFDKLKEEMGELEEAVAGGKPRSEDIAEEFGDMLFVVANLARHLQLDPEDVLRRANGKFVGRFNRIEQMLAVEGRTPNDSNLEEMDQLWNKVKSEERAKDVEPS